MAQLLTISGITIKKPNDFQIEKYFLSSAGRTADGLMHIEKIASKRKFLFKYEVIKGSLMDEILDIIYGDDVFFTLTYIENDVAKSASVYVGAIKSTQFRTDSGAYYYKNFEFDLIEQ